MSHWFFGVVRFGRAELGGDVTHIPFGPVDHISGFPTQIDQPQPLFARETGGAPPLYDCFDLFCTCFRSCMHANVEGLHQVTATIAWDKRTVKTRPWA